MTFATKEQAKNSKYVIWNDSSGYMILYLSVSSLIEFYINIVLFIYLNFTFFSIMDFFAVTCLLKKHHHLSDSSKQSLIALERKYLIVSALFDKFEKYVYCLFFSSLLKEILFLYTGILQFYLKWVIFQDGFISPILKNKTYFKYNLISLDVCNYEAFNKIYLNWNKF